MRDAFADELLRLIEADESVILLTGDLGFGVFDEITKRFPNNFVNVGVAEQNMASIAAGLAMQDYRVFIYSIANFSTFRCLEQIRNDISYHELNVTVVSVGGGFSYGSLGMSHHATEDISIMRSMPGMEVCAPATKMDAESATRYFAYSQKPGYLRIDKSDYKPEEEDHSFVFGECSTVAEGKDITIIATGGILEEAMITRNTLKRDGIRCRVINMHTVKPLDHEAILDASENTGGIIALEEHTIIGGLGSAISEYCLQNSVRPNIFVSMGLNDTFSKVVGDQKYLRKYYGIDSDAITKKIKELVS
jgi:transketolase